MKKLSRLLATASVACIAAGLGPVSAVAEGISFEQILQNPADLGLNFDYAAQKLDEGDLVAAAAALERVLLVEPGWADARFLYAVVLYRLDDLQGAEREFSLIDESALSDTGRADLAHYREKVVVGRSMSRLGGQVSAGLTYDDNAIGVLGDFGSFFSTQSDTGYVFSGLVDYERDLSAVKNLKFFASAQAYTKDFFDLEGSGFTVLQGQTGLQGGKGRLSWSPSVFVRSVAVEGDQYLTELGAVGRLAFNLTPTTILTLVGTYTDEDFNDVTINGFTSFGESGRTGEKKQVEIALEHDFSASTSFSLQAGVVDKSADLSVHAYDGYTGEAHLTHNWSNGVYLGADYAYRDLDYPDAFREEDRHYARLSVGAPLRHLFSGGSDSVTLQELEALTAEFAVYTQQRNSNFSFFEYDNTGVEIRLIWGFGQ